ATGTARADSASGCAGREVRTLPFTSGVTHVYTSTSLAVTVEPDGGSAQPTGQPIVQLTLKSVGFGE
ncbi:hypothetical protein ACWDE9_22640, partial [Streptomyces olivaceoviridis]